MAKKKKVACLGCNKRFKDEAAVTSHASAKGHPRWKPLVPKAAPPVRVAAPVTVPFTTPSRAPTKIHAPSSLRGTVAATLSTQPQPTTQNSPPSQPFAHEFNFKYEHPDRRITFQEAGSAHFSQSSNRLRCSGCDTTFEEEYRLRWHMLCENSCSDCKAHHPSFVALQEHRRVGCYPSSDDITRTSLPVKTSNVSDEGDPSVTTALVSDSSVDVHVPISSEPTTSSVSSVPISTDNAMTEDIETSAVDDVDSVVSYASLVEETEMGTVDLALTNMGSVGTPRDQQTSSPSYSSYAGSAGVLVSPRSPIFADFKESHSGEAALQAGGPSPVAERTHSLPVYPSSPFVRAPLTPSPSTIVPGILSVGDNNDAAGLSEPKQHALHPHVDERPRAAPRVTVDEATSQATANAVGPGVSWHCRSCQRDPCDSPVATICGHIFCQSCICREISTNGCCPVCKKLFLLQLDVAV